VTSCTTSSIVQKENKAQTDQAIVLTTLDAFKYYLGIKDRSTETSTKLLVSVKVSSEDETVYAYGETDHEFQACTKRVHAAAAAVTRDPPRIDCRKHPGHCPKICKYALVFRYKTKYGIGPHKYVIHRYHEECSIVEELPEPGKDLLFGIHFEDGSLCYLDHMQFKINVSCPAKLVVTVEKHTEQMKLAC
jgi:hypothetical protein